MADNTIVSAAVGVGATLAADDIGGVLYPRSKITLGIDGVTDGDVSATNPMPVTGTVTANLGATDNAVLDAIAASVAGTLTVGSHPVTNAGTFAVQVSSAPTTAVTGPLTDTQLRATAVPVSGTVTATVGTVTAVTTLGTITNVVQVGDNSGSLTVDNPQLSVVGTGTEAAALRVTIASDSTGVLSVDDNGSSLTVDGTVTANAGTGTFTVSGAVTNTVLSVVGNGAGATAQRVTLANDSTGIVALTTSTASIGKLASNTGVTIGAVELAAAQTLATVTTVTTCATVTTVTTLNGSAIAHDGADSGNPHKIGARALTSVSAQTLVAANDRTDLFAGLDGVLITRQHCNLEDIVTATPVVITDGSSTSVLASPGAGLRNYITSISIANSSASFVTVDLRDGTAGAVLWTVPVPATGGVVYTFPVPLKFTGATAVAADPSAAASSITVSVLGFKSKV